jgi:hypothetical protein
MVVTREPMLSGSDPKGFGIPWGLTCGLPENRLSPVVVDGDTTTAWIYSSALLPAPARRRGDGDGSLVKREVGGETTVYPSASLRTGLGNLYEKDVAGGQVRKYYYFPSAGLPSTALRAGRAGNGQRVALRKAGVVQYVLGDHPSVPQDRSGQHERGAERRWDGGQ